MTAQILSSELSTLIQESKRKNTELKQAAERSLADLKGLNAGSELQFAQELSNRPTFVSPFILACRTKTTKLCAVAVTALQRVIVSKGLAPSRLKEILDGLAEASTLGLDVQLKILQILPPLLQNYADYLQGDILGDILVLCAGLQVSKNAILNNTAAATLQQLVIPVFDKVALEDDAAEPRPAVGEAPTETGVVPLRRAALDAYRIFLDLCLLTEGQKARFLRIESLPQASGLELIESILSNHADLFAGHPELSHILKLRVMPFVIRSLSDRQTFSSAVRTARIMNSLIQKQLSVLADQFEMALGLLTHMLDPDAAPPWKRALCLEVFKNICGEPALLRKIYSFYDGTEGKKPVLKELMAALTRLATEKPSLIGLGNHSTLPAGNAAIKDSSEQQAALEAGGVAGIIGGAVGLSDVTVPGLSAQWSVVRVPFIDQLDKIDAPTLPESYIYYLTLVCVTNFSEGLAKFVLPFSSTVSESSKGSKRRPQGRSGNKKLDGDDDTASDSVRTPSPGMSSKRREKSRKQLIPTNPLDLKSHSAYRDIELTAMIVEACWPAVLASCSTFLYAALDNDFYHNLIRSFQKFTHIAGLFRLETPRDAFLTTLGKAAVPPHVLTALSAGPPTPTPSESGFISNARGLLSAETLAPPGDRGHSSTDGSNSLNTRNLLCLRALLNLGIALGPTLDGAWAIILETLQQADFCLYSSAKRIAKSTTQTKLDQSRTDGGGLMAGMSSELAAVEAAAAKMFETTKDFPDSSFVALLSALCRLMYDDQETASRKASLEIPATPNKPQMVRSPTKQHKRVSSMAMSISTQIKDNVFALAKMGELAQINLSRLIASAPNTSGWNQLVDHLIQVSSSHLLASHIRMKAAEVLNELAVATARVCAALNREDLGDIQQRLLLALRDEIVALLSTNRSPDSSAKSTDIEIHISILETLNAILEQSGQGISAGWDIVFEIINSAFSSADSIAEETTTSSSAQAPKSRSPKFTRSSFSSLQLICSDFLASLPIPCILILIDTVYAFCKQRDDLNISLTTITYFWNISDFLQQRSGETPVTSNANNEEELMEILKLPDVSGSDLWMFLLLRLTGVSGDSRAEVRNGSIQTLFRIFDTYGHKLSPQAWRPCLTTVVFKMMDIDGSASAKASDSKAWNDTINLVLGGIGTLYANYFEIFSQQAEFVHTWREFIEYLSKLLARRSYEVNTMLFRTLSHVLSKIPDSKRLGKESLDRTWTLWSSQGTTLISEDPATSGNGIQDTLTAYLQVFQPLYALLAPDVSAETLNTALQKFIDCVLFPDAPTYYSDIDALTPLQAVVTENLQLLDTSIPGLLPLLLARLAEFISFPFTVAPGMKFSKKSAKPPTYIALSLFAMEFAEKTVLKHAEREDVYTSGAFAEVIKALAIPVGLKYDFQSPGGPNKRAAMAWIQATRSALSILRSTIPLISKLSLSEVTQTNIIAQTVSLATGLLRANCDSPTTPLDPSTLHQDESHDSHSFTELNTLLIPLLSQPFLPDSLLQTYASTLYQTSILFPTIDSDPATSSAALLSGAWRGRVLGHTDDVAPRARAKMAYVCYAELFSQVQSASEPPTRLSELISGYLLARTGIVLQAFVLDQPLRGKCPQPVARRRELVYTLEKLIELERAGRGSDHLRGVFGLVGRAVVVGRGDAVVVGLLTRVMEAVGGELGGL